MGQKKRFWRKQIVFRVVFFSLLLGIIFVATKAGLRLYTYLRSSQIQTERLMPQLEKLKVHHRRIDTPLPGDWLSEHFEPGQSFSQYEDSDPQRPVENRKTVYVQLLGNFSDRNREIVNTLVDYLSRFFCLPVVLPDPLSADLIPPEARRTNPYSGELQFLTTYISSNLLAGEKPNDAVAYIALTETDLWPGRGWNFVFGQANLLDGTGVWSLSRFGDPERSEEDYKLALIRTLKTAAHEIGHIFGIRHCIAYQCLMNGSNHLAESDGKPLTLCPNCLQKLIWNTGCNPIERFRRLGDFYRQHDIKLPAEFMDDSLKTLKKAVAEAE